MNSNGESRKLALALGGGATLGAAHIGVLKALNEKLDDSVEKLLGDVQIQDSRIPLAIVATDIANCKKAVSTQGSVSQEVVASSCLPGVFSPVDIDDQMLVDGGLVENVPISALHDLGADITLGVDLNAHRSYRKPEDLIDVLINSMDIAIDNATRLQTSDADLVIAPKLQAYSRTDSKQISELLDEGYKLCRSALDASDLFFK